MQDDIILQNTKRSKFSWKVFGLVMTAVAVASLVFGIIMAVVKNDKTPGVSGGDAGLIDGSARINPVLSAEAPAVYTLSTTSFINDENGQSRYVTIKIKNGDILSCETRLESAMDEGTVETCQVSGINGKIYKTIQLYGGAIAGFESGIGLIMIDGTVGYIPVANHTGNVFEVKETLKIDGFVVDGISASVNENEYTKTSSWTTLFVLNDGKVLKFDSSMVTVDSSMDEHLDEGEPLDEGEEL